MTHTPSDDDLADALADVQACRTRGETPDVVAYRPRLGDSHAEFLALVDTDALLDEVIDPPAPEPLPRSFGEYTLLRELGRGAVGVVYEAVHRGLRRRAAVKVLRHGFDTDPQARERFRREALASAQVRHDSVVEIYEAGDVGGQPFYAMALVEGRSLASLIRARELPPVRALCRELAGVADALEALHRAGIVHRDVKPSNVMVRPDGRMLLADFGLARAADGLALTRSGDALGTPLYMSPEQFLGRRNEVDERADVYALGATLYEAISGKPVFHAEDLASLGRLVLTERPTPLRRVASACPPAVEDIAMKALEKRKEDRYPTAAAMRDDLVAFAAGREREVVGHPVGGVVRFMRAARERWIPIAAGVAVAAGVGWWWTHRPATLAIDAAPGAEVIVAGRSRGTSPISLSLSPGTYDVVLRSPGFIDSRRNVALSPGAEKSIETALAPLSGSDPVARLQLARGTGAGAIPYETASLRRDRSGGDGVTLWSPRGDVRLAELTAYAFTLPVDFPESSTLEFRRNGEVLSKAPFDPSNVSMTLPLPGALKAQLRVGDVVTWGLYFPKARGAAKAPKEVVTTFRIVEIDPSKDLERLAARTSDLPEDLRGELRVRLLADRGLLDVARLEADVLADRYPESLALQSVALSIYRSLKLHESSRAMSLDARIARFSDEVRGRFENAKLPQVPETTLPGSK